ncbi:hypothetical protein, partial [Fischerella thermalis]|uniref:hypothetical protein n=1 Tax=Fischerella thermalis TaxID=372787 RepID=UPI001CA4AEEF
RQIKIQQNICLMVTENQTTQFYLKKQSPTNQNANRKSICVYQCASVFIGGRFLTNNYFPSSNSHQT